MGGKGLRRVKEILAPDWDILLEGKKETWNGSNLPENYECLSTHQQSFLPTPVVYVPYLGTAAQDGSTSRRSVSPSQW